MTKNIIYRICNIDKEIKSGKFPNKKTLSIKCEVNTKTIQRDIQYLKEHYDAPIAYSYKRKGFYYTKPFSINPIELSESDFFILAVIDKVLAQYKNCPFEKQIIKFYEKLKFLFDEKISFHIEEIDDLISYKLGPISDINKNIFDKLEQAIRERITTEIKYYAFHTNEILLKKIDPLHLKNFKGNWYLIAYSHSDRDMQIYSLSRILDLKHLRHNFKAHTDFDIDEYFKTSLGMYLGKKNYSIKIKFSPYQAKWIREKKWHHSQRIKELKGGGLILEMELSNLEEIKRWVLKYGKECEVLAPKELRTTIKEELEEGLKKYK